MRFKISSNKKKKVAILVATRNPEGRARIPHDNFTIYEAMSTRGVLDILQHTHPALLVVDLDDLIETADTPRQVLSVALQSVIEDGIPLVTAQQFLAESDQVLGQCLLARGTRTAVGYMSPRVGLVCNYTGGVGKTTLCLAITRRFRQQSGMATALVEASVGGSSLNARVEAGWPSLYTVITQDVEVGQWEGVDLFPSDSREAQVLASDVRTSEALARIVHDHTLTILDAFPGNPLWDRLLNLATDVLVVTTPRPDALAQSEFIYHELTDALQSLDLRPRVHLVLNMVRSVREQLALGGQVSVSLPYDERKAQQLDASLADPLLNVLYPGWSARAKRNRRRK